MKRITAVLKGKVEEIKLNNRVKRVNNALNNAEANAEDALIGNEDKMQEILKSLSKDDVCIEDMINSLKKCIETKHSIEEGIAHIKEIREYLEQDIPVEEK